MAVTTRPARPYAARSRAPGAAPGAPGGTSGGTSGGTAGGRGANGAGFADVACVRYYRVIRDGAAADAAQIGYGVNRTPPPPVVRRWLTALYRQFLRRRVTDYDVPDSAAERRLVARLAARYLGLPALGPDHVVLCNGSSEAISVVTAYAARRAMRAVLPLPVYFGFEQSAARHGVPVAAYYNVAGQVAAVRPNAGRPNAGRPDSVRLGSVRRGDVRLDRVRLDRVRLGGVRAGGVRPVLLVEVVPNGVFGVWPDPPPPLFGEPALRVVDHVFALPAYQAGPRFLRGLRGRVTDLARTAVLFTPSKDLSLPGLRCGAIVTADPGLLAHAHADRFERGYCVQGGIAGICAAHLALLLVAFAPQGRLGRLARELRCEFAAAGLAFPGDAELARFRADLAVTRAAFAESMALIDRSPLFAPVPGVGEQVAGYSGFRRLDGPFGDADGLTDWVRRAGRAGMKLNPNYLFGGEPEVWGRLYPDVYGVRVNVSVPPALLARDLARLRGLLTR